MRKDIYATITDNILAELEKGTRPWRRPWNAEHAAGRITRPLRAKGIPCRGINVLSLWMEAEAKGMAYVTAQRSFGSCDGEPGRVACLYAKEFWSSFHPEDKISKK